MSIVVFILMALGCAFVLLAALGSLKFPDTLTRMAAVCKASTLGSVFFCAAGILHFQELVIGVLLTTAALVLFLGIPITSHLVSRVRMRSLGDAPLQTQRNDYLDDVKSSETK